MNALMADLEQLLIQTSRTFALSIPRLPGSVRREVALAYLLFRIADTFEDAARWPRARRLAALGDFGALLQRRDRAKAASLALSWVAASPCDHEGYLELLAHTPDVIEEIDKLTPEARAVVIKHALRTTEGMASYVSRSTDDGALQLQDIEDLRNYCYIVAGIVGELLTELFVLADPKLQKAGALLETRSKVFGEGLQLVNILKDAGDDAKEGRVYLPPGVERAEVFALARNDLRTAAEYVRALHAAGTERGFVEFTALPVILAKATLDAVEMQGSGAKVSRVRVAEMVTALDERLDHGKDVFGTDTGW